MQALGFPLQEEAVLKTLTEDVLKSSEIEGEILDKDQVRSSIARRLGIDAGALPPADRNVEGVVEMMLDATQRFDQPAQRRTTIWLARRARFRTGRSGLSKIKVAQWRDEESGPMRVVSGAYGREQVHYEAPAADRLDDEMQRFLTWFNLEDKLDPVIKAALAHLWFITIHPFRRRQRSHRACDRRHVACAVGRQPTTLLQHVERKSSRSGMPITTCSKRLQKGDLDITRWLEWFLACLDRAFDGAEAILSSVLRKAEFWKVHSATSLNDRQRDILNRLLDEFEGKLTSSKWAKIENCSADTALRDINELVARGILAKDEGGGRSTSYSLTEIKADG